MVGARPLSSSRWRRARWLVIAPHADDETLGAGALIAEAAEQGRLAGVVYLTDGTGSHPHADAASRARLKALRRVEALKACRILTGGRDCPLIFLDWPDAGPLVPESAGHQTSVQQLAALCRRRRVDAIAVTSEVEPHCDHAAAGRLAVAAARAALRPVAVFDYLVWSETAPPGPVFSTRPINPGRRRAALAAHRSQLTPVFGEGFRLPSPRQHMPARDRLYPRARS